MPWEAAFLFVPDRTCDDQEDRKHERGTTETDRFLWGR